MSTGDLGLPCVHCGLCLDTCPTYRVLGTEADSPRGRLWLMKGIRDGEMPLDDDAATHLSRCLGCLACETACPSGVSFGRHIEEFRPKLAARGDAASRWKRAASQVYSNATAVEAGLKAADLLDRAGLASMRRKVPGLGILPAAEAASASAALARDDADASVSPLRRSRTHQPLRARARVALLTGCVGDRLLPGINRDTVEVLQHNGVEVVDVPGQGCCGALDLHAGRPEEARRLAAANAAAFAAADVDFVVSTAAGCGAMLADYLHVLGGSEDAALLASRARDICEVLVELGFEEPSRRIEVEGAVAYHDACHLLHARRISTPPRLVVEAACGTPPVDLGENAICCGSAGSYNIDHPELAAELGGRKAALAAERGAGLVAVANVGCMLQIARALTLAGSRAIVRHPVQLLAEAYRRSRTAGASDD